MCSLKITVPNFSIVKKDKVYSVSKIFEKSFLFDFHMKGKPIQFDESKLFNTETQFFFFRNGKFYFKS